LLKSANVSRSYLKNESGTFLDHGVEGNTVFKLFTCQQQKQRIFNCCIQTLTLVMMMTMDE